MMHTPFAAINLDGLRGVLIDLDNTLYAYDPAHAVALRQAYASAGWNIPFEDFADQYRNARNATLERLKPQGACRSRLFAFQAMCEASNVPQSYMQAFELNRVYWQSFIDAMQIDTEALAFLKRCKAAKLPVCVVSDMTAEVQIRKLIKLGITSYIDHLVTSEEVGAEKPDARMFEAGLKKLDVQPHEAIMVGDDLKKDIAGAAAAGIKAFHIKAQA